MVSPKNKGLPLYYGEDVLQPVLVESLLDLHQKQERGELLLTDEERDGLRHLFHHGANGTLEGVWVVPYPSADLLKRLVPSGKQKEELREDAVGILYSWMAQAFQQARSLEDGEDSWITFKLAYSTHDHKTDEPLFSLRVVVKDERIVI